MGTITNTYYGTAQELSEDEQSVCCVVQLGTGNTKKTSKLVERWFPYSAMKNIVGHYLEDDFSIYPKVYFRVKITEGNNSIKYKFYRQKPTKEIKDLFKKPDYFNGLDTSTLFDKE